MRFGGCFLTCMVLCGGLHAQEEDVEGPSITHEAIPVAVVGKDLLILASFADENGVFEPAVLYRVGSQGEFLSVPMEATGDGDTWAANIPGDLVVADIEYFVEAFDELGNGPSREGDPELPMTIRVVAPNEDLPGDGDGDDSGDGDGDGTGGDGDAEDESEGLGLGLWLGVGGAAGGVAVLAAAAGATAAVFSYFYFFSGTDNPTPPSVTVIVGTPSPTGAALMPGVP